MNNADWAIGSAGNGWAANFAGLVDEVAIYNYALSASRIAQHYSVAINGATPVTLTIVRSGSNVIITWSSGTLQQASFITGPWTDVVATSPYNTPAIGQKFFRVKL
jgi:hypothetical protein